MFRRVAFSLVVALGRTTRDAAAAFRAQSIPRRTVLVSPFALAACAAADEGELRFPPTTATIARVMLPDDANPGGNVHGGTILKMIDQAGYIAATQYCNQGHREPALQASLARLEKCEFLAPMHIGEVAQLEATVTYVAPHSMEVNVEVHALNVFTGVRRRTNVARAWYIARPLGAPKEQKAASLSHMVHSSAGAEAEGHVRYERQRVGRQGEAAIRAVTSQCETVRQDMMRLHLDPSQRVEHSPADSASSLVQLMLPSDCVDGGRVQAGAVMKLMDNVAGIVAVKHCRSNVVTASVDAMDFHTPVHNGSLLSLYAWPTYTSERSIEITVAVFAESMHSPRPVLCNSSHFTFVSLQGGRVAPVPQLALATDADRERWEEGSTRYAEAKRNRTPKKASL